VKEINIGFIQPLRKHFVLRRPGRLRPRWLGGGGDLRTDVVVGGLGATA